MQLLKSAGIDFDELRTRGIDGGLFAEHLFTAGISGKTNCDCAGLVLNADLRWVTYRGTFDMGYMLRAAMSEKLPDTESGFFDKLQVYFPNFCDIKCMLRDIDIPTLSLNSTATFLNVSGAM